jgi:hypothetical protein
MVNVLRCTQVFFTQSLLRPDVKHNARDVKREDAQNVFDIGSYACSISR